MGMPAASMLSVAAAQFGRPGQALKGLEKAVAHYRTIGRPPSEIISELGLGRFYLEVLKAKGQVGLGSMARNVGFIVKHASAARKRAIAHLTRAVELSRDHDAFGFMGPAYLFLGRIHAQNGNTQEARTCFRKAMEVFENAVQTSTWPRQGGTSSKRGRP
ncbi:MAG: tetratricopeptide repeat protein [Desulfobacteraceae bacterium]|nr:MAG: tetratricopeptide repeat protein [Desulfobacteraceae bacterium]